eukprot:CAMPEP_0177759766 /NCGR_PEP_ID=MMETSP0491_2-20121128/4903_1 /TAXON_ID=63592 /ORGANISM="Tetraselmis chuii, Strain PLY429" /LENGTH=318 /DNA_ID=CAMNT_0019275609 /DNA_START=86 /DNA_END=1038 /DNA_ORIENTATION=-
MNDRLRYSGRWATCLCIVAVLLPVCCLDSVPNRTELAVDVQSVTSNEGSAEIKGEPELESLLHWAISNSDPGVLQQQALAASGKEGTKKSVEELRELAKRRAKVREAIEAFAEEPTETELIEEAVAILNSYLSSDWGEAKLEVTQSVAAVSSQDGEAAFRAAVGIAENALQALQLLCEPIDNANDLGGLGGKAPVVTLLSDVRHLRVAAAGVLGVAATNNPTFQGELLKEQPQVLGALIAMLGSDDDNEAGRALYAMAAIVRNMHSAQDLFRSNGGVASVVKLLGRTASSGKLKLASRSIQLLADLVVENQSFLQQIL